MVAVNRPRLLRFRRRMLRQQEWDGTFGVGRKPGLKVDRPSRIMDRCDSIRTAIRLVDEDHWEKLCKSDAHLGKRQWIRHILDQDGIGSCGAEGAAAGKAGRDAAQNLREILYNPWGAYRTTSGGVDRGSNIGDNVEFVRDKGLPPEELHPRSLGWRAEMSPEAKRVAKLFRLLSFFYVKNIKELVSALLQGFLVHGGYSGHSVLFVLYLGSGKLLFANSWDESWGDNGFGVLSVDKVYFSYGAYGYQNVLHYTDEDWKPKHDQAQLARAVNRFMVSMGSVYQPWSDRQHNRRIEEYRQSLQACGLAG